MSKIEIVNKTETINLNEMKEPAQAVAAVKPKQQIKQKQKKKPDPVIFSLDKEITLKADNKTDKIFFTSILQNKKPGIFTNILSKTPDNQHTLTTFKNNNYIYIEYNDMFKAFLYSLYDNFDPEFIHRINDEYQYEAFINSCEVNGYIKCKVDNQNYNNPSFFSTVVKDAKNKKKTIQPLKNVDFMYDRINKAVYSLKVSGFWRKIQQVKGMSLTTGAGLSIKVLGVLVSKYTNEDTDNTQNEEYEARQQTQLKNDSLDLLEAEADDDDED